jgi:tRNA (guanine-N7-)-methyltransferase
MKPFSLPDTPDESTTAVDLPVSADANLNHSADQPDSPDDIADNSEETPDSAADNALRHRKIRSFVTRAGRASKGQLRALEALGPEFCLPYTAAPLDWAQTFGRSAPRILEIGFGMGVTTAEIAVLRPQDDFLGLEVHQAGVGALLKLIGEQDLTNIRMMQHDAVEVVEHMIAPDTLDGIHIFFPDPWHKSRHHKRRLIQPPFVALLASRLRPGGYLHCATDWENYAEQMLAVLGAEASLENTAEGYAPRPAYRPVTKFERRGIKLGHGVWDLLFKRRVS